MKYKAVFLDIDDTLLDYDTCCRQAFDYAMEAIHEPSSDELFRLFFDIANRLFEEAKHGQHTIAEVMELYPREFIERSGLGMELLDDFKTRFREGWGLSHAQVDGADELLRALHGRYRLYAASNSFAHLQRQRLELAGLLGMLDDAYVSSEIGFDKPDVRFYEEALRRSGLRPQEVLMVGDSETTDIIGARQAGLDTCWFNPKEKERPDLHPTYMVRSLREIIPLL